MPVYDVPFMVKIVDICQPLVKPSVQRQGKIR